MAQITQFLRRALQMNAHGTATVFNDRTQDWAKFAGRSDRLAGALVSLGFQPGDRIGILGMNSDRYLECFFGISHGGFVFVPINTRLAPPEIVYWLTDSGCAGLFVDDSFAAMLPAILPRTPEIRHVIHFGDGAAGEASVADSQHRYEALIDGASAVPDSGRGGQDLAGIFYTGGTTGRSKGVMLSHANILANAHNFLPEAHITQRTRYIHAAPMFHLADGALTFLVTAFGGTHYFLPRFEPGAMLRAMADGRVTHTLIVPTMVNMLVHHPEVTKVDLAALERLFYGASPMPEAVARRAMEVMPHVKFSQAYGQSEAAPVMTVLPPEYNTFDGPNGGRAKSAGRPVLDCEIKIMDPDDNEVPRGTVGEICGRGAMVMLGYWKQPELTAHTLRNGWLHTGDGGYMDDEGFVYVVDRVKDMIVSGGENVYSAEVEEALYSHTAVSECAVIGVPDDTWGERVHAIVRLKPGTDVTAEALIAHCHGLIANYKCPRTLVLREDPLPLSGAGKILKSDLRKPFWEGREKKVN